MAFRVADLIVDALIAHGVDRAFGVPGESFLALLDALYERDEIDLVTCRHEGSASLAAVADAKLHAELEAALGPEQFAAFVGKGRRLDVRSVYTTVDRALQTIAAAKRN